ncbi:neuropeptide FF receptor 1-like [Orbicella faveolata]|uniref:neuropeptide FF receptor 1-like n=1 Tax=Orbicella faveolata TaxID=48498 RepID=UPI0009E1A79D|nr:neuropeptide FF receptor 1-like [Orbicella faveolata]XP_020621494.1 neuropeptide FF receptor 1-like [Orbicella faveolata]
MEAIFTNTMVHINFRGNSSNDLQNSTSVTLSSTESAKFKIVKLFFYAIIFLISVIGNTLVCIVIVRRHRMRTVTNCFILNLAVADLAITCICIPFDIPVQENNYKWPYGSLLCKLLYPLQTMAMFASIFTLMAVSLNRYWAIVYPLQNQMSKRHAKGFISVIWLLSALVTLPYILVLRLDEETVSCEEHWPVNVNYRKAYTLSLFLVQYVVPLTVITLVYLKIAREMRKCIKKRKTSCINRDLSKSHQIERKRVVRMLIVVTALFAVCVLPNNIMWLWLDFGNGEEYEHFWDVVAVTNIILFANSAANPIAYTICHDNFREEFRHYVSCDRNIFKSILERSSFSRAQRASYYTTTWTRISSMKGRELKKMMKNAPETDV